MTSFLTGCLCWTPTRRTAGGLANTLLVELEEEVQPSIVLEPVRPSPIPEELVSV